MADDDESKGLQPSSGGLPEQPPDGQPPAVSDEQWREFQRFQEFQQAQGRRRLPKWLRWLLGRVVRWVVLILVLSLAALWAYNHYFGKPDEQLPASQTGGGKTERNLVFETTPTEAVRKLYDNIAQDIADDACTRFETAELAEEFGIAFGGFDCADGIHKLNARVGTANDYAEARFPPSMDLRPKADGTVVISSCEMVVEDGPRLGRFTVRKIPNSLKEQWTISGWAAEPAVCPA